MSDRDKAIAEARAALERVLAGKRVIVAGDAAGLGSIAVPPHSRTPRFIPGCCAGAMTFEEELAHRARHEVLADALADLAEPLRRGDRLALADVAAKAEHGWEKTAKATAKARGQRAQNGRARDEWIRGHVAEILRRKPKASNVEIARSLTRRQEEDFGEGLRPIGEKTARRIRETLTPKD